MSLQPRELDAALVEMAKRTLTLSKHELTAIDGQLPEVPRFNK